MLIIDQVILTSLLKCPKGFRNVRVHDLKHTFGRRLRAAGVPLETRRVLWTYLLVGGGHPIWEEAIESLVNPRQSEMKQMIEPRFTPAHTYPFEALLNQPFTGTFH
jgi:hypothetical protein